MAIKAKDQQQTISQGNNLEITNVEVELPAWGVQVKETNNDQQLEPIVNDYNLARDKVRRNIVPPGRCNSRAFFFFF